MGVALLLLGALTTNGLASPGGWDPSYAPILNGGAVNAMALQADGKLLIGGAFTSVNNSGSRYHLARLYSDGSLDPAFLTNSSGVSSTIYCLAVQADGRIDIGGDFTSVNGTARTRVARLNANGTVDGSFIPTNTIGSSVLALAAQTDNKVIIGGLFSGSIFPSWNARLNADGTVDSSFASYPNGPVYAIALQTNGAILLGGAFTTLNGAPRNRIARLNPDGSLDNLFQNGLSGASATVRCLQVQPDGKILIGGDFTAVNNTSRGHVARLNIDGSLDAGFLSSAGAAGPVFALAAQTDNSLLIAGSFSAYASYNLSDVARLYPDGTRDTSFSTSGINAPVQSLALQGDGSVLIGGAFSTINNTNRFYLARLYGNLYPPEFVTQPVSRSTNVGASVTFSAQLSNPTPSSFQWRKDGNNIPLAAGVSYTLNNIQLADAGSYSVFVGNAAGGATSSNAVLRVGIPPAISQQPVSLAVAQGQAVTFTVGATGWPLSYFWAKDGAPIPGATNFTLTIASPVFTNSGAYACLVSNFLGSVTTASAQLTVFAPPVIAVQPANLIVGVGSDFTLSVLANGTAPLSYQWSKDGSPLAASTSSILTVNNARTNDSGDYSVLITNSFGSLTSAVAQVNVGYAPLITRQPQSFTNDLGTSNAFSVVALGSEPLTYQWFKDSVAIVNATNSLLQLPNLQSNQVGSYSVALTNIYGWAVSSDALLSIPGVPATFLWQGLVAYYPFSGNASDASGNGNDGIVTGATLGTNRFGIPSDSYVLTATGSYPTWLGDYITTSNANGFPISTNDFTASAWVLLSSNSPDCQIIFCNQEVNQFQFGFSIFSGSTATLQFYSGQGLVAPSCESAVLDWTLGQWYNVQVVRATNTITIYRNGSLVGQNVWTEGNEAAPADRILDFGFRLAPTNHPFMGQLDDIRLYNRALSSSEIAQLYAYEADVPVIIAQPQGSVVMQGGTASFSVAATSLNPLACAWSKDQVPIPDATNTTLFISGVQPSQAGLYSAAISNSFSGIVSAPAPLVVISSAGAGAPGFTSNQFGFGLTGPAGGSILIESSTNLSDWRPIITNVFDGGPFLFLDPASSTNPATFYRMRAN